MIHELDDETAAAIASVKVREQFEGQGKARTLVAYTRKGAVLEQDRRR